MSLYKPKAVYVGSERNTLQQVEKFKYIVVVFTSYGRKSDEADGLLKITQFFMNVIALWPQKESPAPQSCKFLNQSLFRSLPMILNLG